MILAVLMQEMGPAFIRKAVLMHTKKRTPARCERLALRVHIGLVRELVSLAGVATETRGDDVIPSGSAAFIARRDVIEIQLSLGQNLGAILAGELVPQEHVAAGEFHLEPRQAIVNQEDHDLRHADGDLCTVDHLRIGISVRVADP